MLATSTADKIQTSHLTKVDLSERIPLYDPGCWYTRLYGHFPAAEIKSLSCLAEHSEKLCREARASAYRFLLLDADSCNVSATELANFINLAVSQDLHVVAYGSRHIDGCNFAPSREAAIASYLKVWEQEQLNRFSW